MDNFNKKTCHSNSSLAKCTSMFTLQGNNYFVYTCQNGHRQIKLGKRVSYEEA